jgi:hypothetical protein
LVVLHDAKETVDEGGWSRIAVKELVLGAGMGTSEMVSSNGRRKVEVGDSTIFREVETSTHDTDLGIVGVGVELEDLDLRRLVDILRHSLPSDIERVGLNTFFSCSIVSTGSAGLILKSGNDKRGLGFGRVGSDGPGLVMFGVLLNDSLDKNGVRAFESGCPISLFERCTPGRAGGGKSELKSSRGVRWTIVAGVIDPVFATPISPMEVILYSGALWVDIPVIELARDLKSVCRLRVAGLELELIVRAGETFGLAVSLMGEAVKSTPGWVEGGLGVWVDSGSSNSSDGKGMMVFPLRKDACCRTASGLAGIVAKSTSEPSSRICFMSIIFRPLPSMSASLSPLM